MFILKNGHQPGVYVPLRALFLVFSSTYPFWVFYFYFPLPTALFAKTSRKPTNKKTGHSYREYLYHLDTESRVIILSRHDHRVCGWADCSIRMLYANTTTGFPQDDA